MTASDANRQLKVAIIGGGLGGLAAAIEMAKVSFVKWELYEQKPRISETGGGISLQPHTWRLLEHTGAAANLDPKDFHRSVNSQIEQRCNGRSGKLLLKQFHPKHILARHQSCRLVRAKLQTALLKNVDRTHIHVGKRLRGLEHLPHNRIRISFVDGFVDEVDLVVGADGIRSFVRKFSFPGYGIHYRGQSVYRTIISKAEVAKIHELPWIPTFWKHVSGLYVFTSPLGNDDFEVTARIRRLREGQEQVSWGQPFDFRTLLHEYDDFCLPVRKILHLAAEGETQEFALFHGPQLQSVVSHGNIALIGDASHPLSGNFGAGAGFALEDVYTLTKALEWAWLRREPWDVALQLFDSVRSPHYKALHGIINMFAIIKEEVLKDGLSIDEEIEERVKRIGHASESWMYRYEIERVVNEALHKADETGGYVLADAESTE